VGGTFSVGISGATVSGSPVLVDGNGQLGVAPSSHRFKEEIDDMGEASSGLLSLRPVTFRYKEDAVSNPRPVEFGLIAEEVAEVFPELVALDEEGKPKAVLYRLLAPMLLNELQKQARLDQEQEAEIESLKTQLALVQQRLAELDSAPRDAEAVMASVP
jgi:hypothetical protein